MKAHERTSHHTQPSQALLVISKQGSVVQELQRVDMQERFIADVCTDITAVEELSVFCCWEEDGTPVKLFLDMCL